MGHPPGTQGHGCAMVRRSIFMPQRSRAGADASAHVGHAPRLFGRRGGAGVSNKGKYKITDTESEDNQNNIEKLARYIGRKKSPRRIANVLCALSAEILVEKVN